MQQLSRSISFQTPAKVNFFLNLLGKRKDGYHELFLDLIPISLFDEINLTPNPHKQLYLKSNLETQGSQENNLVIKAVRKLEEWTGEQIYLNIELKKQIPVGAGLGGGSGNAGAILTVLNQMLELDLSIKQLQELSLPLGADVPFFIDPRPVQAEGIGEIFTPIQEEFDSIPLLLLYPKFSISTAQAYANCRISGKRNPIGSYAEITQTPFSPQLNDFWDSLQLAYPKLKKCREGMLNAGAQASGMSGSGSTIFGIFDSQEKRGQAFQILQEQKLGSLFYCETLSHWTYLKNTKILSR